MSKKIIIAIDGPSACGKSTLAKDLARELGYLYVDSGAMYRAATYHFLKHHIDLTNSIKVTESLKSMNLHLRMDNQGRCVVSINDLELFDELRSAIVNENVSAVSALGSVRKHLVQMQQHIGLHRAVVMDGRDIGSVVFPDAELKIFLTASLKVRVHRRYEESLKKGSNLSLPEIENNLIKRDHIDSTRIESPLVQTEDAVVIDNSNLTRIEQAAMMLALAKVRCLIVQQPG